MAKRAGQTRVLIYSHDSFGLGHLRRCRAIAHELAKQNSDMSIMILSGSPIIGSFDFRNRVDFVRIPGVIKLHNGEYTSMNLNIDTDEIMAIRASIIEHTAAIFDPDLFLVDKEPLGLRGEVRGTLEILKRRGTPLALGLRDVMDEPALLAPEWERKNVLPALEDLYDSIWVYGLPQICDPMEGIDLPQGVRDKMIYTGYLRREATPKARPAIDIFDRPYFLVTPGGGGDGETMVDWVIRAYESGAEIPHPALIVLGPFMQRELQDSFMERAADLKNIEVITFDSHLENLMVDAVGVVAMGGYNTFCEILSFDKRALLLPRTEPRLEQYIRTSRAEEIGLVRMIDAAAAPDPAPMVQALCRLPYQRVPSEVSVPGLLSGLESVDALVGNIVNAPKPFPFPKLQTA